MRAVVRVTIVQCLVVRAVVRAVVRVTIVQCVFSSEGSSEGNHFTVSSSEGSSEGSHCTVCV